MDVLKNYNIKDKYQLAGGYELSALRDELSAMSYQR